MLIQYCSDLHLEFPENRKFILRNPLKPVGDVLVLAGDIIPLNMLEEAGDFIQTVSDLFERVYWIPGNHEYYHFDLADKPSPFIELLRENVWLLNNQAVIYRDVKFVCSTLWSEIGPSHETDIQRNISDFYAIREDGKPFTARSFNNLHRECLHFLAESLGVGTTSASDERVSARDIGPNTAGMPLQRTVVVTHHVPSLLNYPNRYRKSPLNHAFATELFAFIERVPANCWIYGHHHNNTPAFRIGTVEMLTNQLGYVHHYEHGSFRRDAIIDV